MDPFSLTTKQDSICPSLYCTCPLIKATSWSEMSFLLDGDDYLDHHDHDRTKGLISKIAHVEKILLKLASFLFYFITNTVTSSPSIDVTTWVLKYKWELTYIVYNEKQTWICLTFKSWTQMVIFILTNRSIHCYLSSLKKIYLTLTYQQGF